MGKPVCKGECLFGKCPHKVCIKYAGGNKTVSKPTAKMKILTDFDLEKCDLEKDGYGIAIDIGTTTVAAFLYQMKSAEPLAVNSQINSQVSFGPDVISRIKFCGDMADGLDILHKAIIGQLNEMIENLCAEANVSTDDITYCVITGNTTMLHLLCKISPVSMGVLPFEPESYFGETREAASVGLNLKQSKLYLPPCLFSFVGADITTDMIAAGFVDTDKHYLLMDIGTNGEVALGNKNGIVASSTAAGPAFEGAHISCGMAGVNGAINSVYVQQGELKYTTVGDVEPRGMCGSGLLDAVAVFTLAGAIDETGKINTKDNPYVIDVDGHAALKITDGVYLSQKDIREFQTAKAAVAAGVLTLMHDAGITESDVDTIFIAGGFGNYMDINSAQIVGLVPGGVQIKSVGNSAAAGAVLLLLDDSYQAAGDFIKNKAKHVELGNHPYFVEKYMDCMYF